MVLAVTRKLHVGLSALLLWPGRMPSQGTTPPEPTHPSNEVRPAIRWNQFNYTCEGGTKLTLYLHNETARVRFNGHGYLMTQTRSADGNRYSDGKVVWWGKGDGGFLEEDAPDGNGKMMAKGCRRDKPMNTTAATGMITGTVAYLERIALPPSAIIQVQLQDVSRADAPAKTIAEKNITLGERQVPVPFELEFDPAKIDEKRAYAVRARIVVDDRLRFFTDKAYPVLTRDNPSHAEIVLKAAQDHSEKP